MGRAFAEGMASIDWEDASEMLMGRGFLTCVLCNLFILMYVNLMWGCKLDLCEFDVCKFDVCKFQYNLRLFS